MFPAAAAAARHGGGNTMGMSSWGHLLQGTDSVQSSLSPLLLLRHHDDSSVGASVAPRARFDHTHNNSSGFHSALLAPSSSSSSSSASTSLHHPLPSHLPFFSTSSNSLRQPLTYQPPSLLRPSSSPASPLSSGALFPPPPLSPAGNLFPPSNLLWTLDEPGTIALTVMYCLSFALGFAGNLMSLRVLTNRSSRRLAGVSATRSLLVNLAVCDLAVVCVCMPITLGSKIYTSWVYGDFMCRAVHFTQAVSVSASVLTLTVISVNRYYSVRSPLRARAAFTRRRTLVTVAVVWAVSTAICAPIAVMNRPEEVNLGPFAILVCHEVWPQPRLKTGYNVVLFVALYCLPVTFNLAISFLTGRRLWGAGKRSAFSDLDPRSQALHASRLKMRQKIAKMVVCLVLLFAVSWLPLYVADLWMDLDQQHPPVWLPQAHRFAQWLGLTNSSLNPICYCFMGDVYRSAKVIRTRYCQKVVALFGSSSFASTSTAMTDITGAVATTKRPGAAQPHHGIAAATVAASASLVTSPRLLNLAAGQNLVAGQNLAAGQLGVRLGVPSPGCGDDDDSDLSMSDWYKSNASVCDTSSMPDDHLQYSTVHSAGFLPPTPPTRRLSVNVQTGLLPLRIESVEINILPLRRHSGGKTYALSSDDRSSGRVLAAAADRSKLSQAFSVVGDADDSDKRTHVTIL